MSDLAFWVAVYVSLTVGAMAGMFIVAALHDCHRQPQRREQCRHVRLITPADGVKHAPYDWERPEPGEPIGSDPSQSLKRRWDA